MARKLIATSMAAGVAFALAATAHAADSESGWTQQSFPFPTGNILAVTNLDAHTVWAVGFIQTLQGEGESLTPVVVSRDTASGGAWQVVQTLVSADARADAISADGPDDVWVTGDSTGDGTGPLTEHWNGKTWTVVPAPLPAGADSSGELLGVVTLSANNAWAVGNGQDAATITGVIEHWDGKSWQQSTLPASVSTNLMLNAVTADGPHDLWAAGENYATGQPVLLHGNGKTWQQISVPTAGAPYADINALSTDGTGGVYVVGTAHLTASDWGHPLVEHWNADTWQPTPVPPGAGVLLSAALTPQGLAVGGYIPGADVDAYGETLHDGAWQSLNVPGVGTDMTELTAITSTYAGLLAVGSYSPNDDGVSIAPLALQQSNG